MELFSVNCTTCKSRLKVRDPSAIGHILACPKCGGMVMIKAPANWSEGSSARAELPTVSDVISASPAQERKLTSSAFEAVEDLLSDAPPKLPSAGPPSASPPSAAPPSASPTPARATPTVPLPKQRFTGAPRPTPPPMPAAPPPAKQESPSASANPVSTASNDSGKQPPPAKESEPALPSAVEGGDTRWRYWLVAGGSAAVGIVLTFAAVSAGMYLLRGPSLGDPLEKKATSVIEQPPMPEKASEPNEPSPPAVAQDSATAPATQPSPAKPVPAGPGAETSAAPVAATNQNPPSADPLGLITTPPPATASPAVTTNSLAKIEKLIGSEDVGPQAAAATQPATSSANVAVAPEPASTKAAAPRPAARDIDLAKRLADPIMEIQTSQSPLADFLFDLSEFSTIPITLEPDPLVLVKVTPESPVLLNATNTTLGGALTQALKAIKLEYVASGDQLVVRLAEPAPPTTIEVSAKYLTDGSEQQLQELAELFQALIEPASWGEGAEKGTVTLDTAKNSLLVRSNRAVQAQMLLTADRLRAARGKPAVLKLDAAVFKPESRWKLAQGPLMKPVSLNYGQPTRLVTILDSLGEAGGVRILIDWRDVAALGWNPAGEATLAIQQQPLVAALDALLAPLDLAWRVVDGQTLQVITPARLSERLELELYPVADLAKRESSSEGLLAKLRAELDEAAFREGGGAGELRFDAESNCLLAALPQPRQRELEALLAKWRAATATK